MKNINLSVYEKFKKIIAEQKERELKAAEKDLQRQAKIIQKQQQTIQKQEEKLRQQREKERERAQKTAKREAAKREKALEKIREQERQRYLKQQAKEDRQRAKADQQRLGKERKKWKREIRQEEHRQAKVLDGLRWKGSKKRLRDNRRKLQKNLIKIHQEGRNLRPRLVSEAIRRNTSKWSINGGGFRDPRTILDITTPAVKRLINSIDSVGKKVHTSLKLKLVRTDPESNTNQYTISHFRSKTHSMISEEDVNSDYEVMKEKILESFAKYQNMGSGWRLYNIIELEIFTTKYRPLNGRGWKTIA